MAQHDDIPRICRDAEILRTHAAAVAAEAALRIQELRQSLAERSGLLEWTAEARASTIELWGSGEPPANTVRWGEPAGPSPRLDWVKEKRRILPP